MMRPSVDPIGSASRAGPTRPPVVLVHGLLSHPRCFLLLARRLRSAGFERVATFRYSPFDRGVLDIATALGRFIGHVVAKTEAAGVHLVGHSLGGLVARTYAQLVDAEHTTFTSVGIGSPDGGTDLARIGAGGIARDLRPRSSLLRELDDSPVRSGLRLVGFYGERDRIARRPPFDDPSSSSPLASVRVFRRVGHIGLLFSRDVADALERELAISERCVAGVSDAGPRRRFAV